MKINAINAWPGKDIGWCTIFHQINTAFIVRRIWRGNGGIRLDLLDNVPEGVHNELLEEAYKLP